MIWFAVTIYVAVALIALKHILQMLLRTGDVFDHADLACVVYFAVFWPVFWPLTVLLCHDWKQVDQARLRKIAGLKDWES